MKEYPKYIKSTDGYVGTFRRLEYGQLPIYRFAGGERMADEVETRHGADTIEELPESLEAVENQELFNALADLEQRLFYASQRNESMGSAHHHVREALEAFATATGCHNE